MDSVKKRKKLNEEYRHAAEVQFKPTKKTYSMTHKPYECVSKQIWKH